MTPEQEAHIGRIRAQIGQDITRKYERGQVEHGGNIWEKPRLLDQAIEEVLDLAVYLYTLREKRQRELEAEPVVGEFTD